MRIYGPYTRKKDGRQHIIKIFRDGRRVTQSYPRYLMEKKLGRKLLPTEEVDHIDNDFTNNALDNFQILTKPENIRKSRKPAEVYYFVCPTCERPTVKSASQVKHNRGLSKSGPYCSRRCAGVAQRQRRLP